MLFNRYLIVIYRKSQVLTPVSTERCWYWKVLTPAEAYRYQQVIMCININACQYQCFEIDRVGMPMDIEAVSSNAYWYQNRYRN